MAATTLAWRGGELAAREDCDVHPARTVAADSWLVADGRVRALDLHRTRFLGALPAAFAPLDPAAFWDRAVATLPRAGAWFPRVDARVQGEAPQLLLRLRDAPALSDRVVLATHRGEDPRRAPRVKGPDLEAMLRLRTDAQARGAQEAVLLEPDGAVAEGSTSCLVWWRGDALALPSDDIARIDSVTVRSLLAVATARGVPVERERAPLESLEGCEVWALNALHGVRMVTGWVDGPATAAEPGRLALWRTALEALRRPLPGPDGGPAA